MSTDQTTLEAFDDLERDVYVTKAVSHGSKVYHTDNDCVYISETGHKSISLSNAKERGLSECKHCSGEAGYADSEPTPDERCSAKTTEGNQCRNYSLAGFDRCEIHLGESDETETDSSSSDKPVWERQRDDLMGEQ